MKATNAGSQTAVAKNDQIRALNAEVADLKARLASAQKALEGLMAPPLRTVEGGGNDAMAPRDNGDHGHRGAGVGNKASVDGRSVAGDWQERLKERL